MPCRTRGVLLLHLSPTMSSVRATVFKGRIPSFRQHRFDAPSVARLEAVFRSCPIPTREARLALARDLSVSERQIQVWLQNKRQRTKRRAEALQGYGQGGYATSSPWISPAAQRAPLCEASVHDDMSMEIFLEGHAPFQVLWASDDWLQFCGFSGAELRGQTMRIIQGPATDRDAAEMLSEAGSNRCCGEATLINYTKARVPFRHTLRIEPLVNTFGQLRIYRASSKDVQVLDSA